MAVHPLKQPCGGYHEPGSCGYCKWILEEAIKDALDRVDIREVLDGQVNEFDPIDLTNLEPDILPKKDCPSCASLRAEVERLKAEVSDATALAYNLDPDRAEPSEMGLCEQIAHLENHLWPHGIISGANVPPCSACSEREAEVARLKEGMRWYIDYANGKDRAVAEEIGRCNKAEARIKQLEDAVEWANNKFQDIGSQHWSDELRRRAGMEGK